MPSAPAVEEQKLPLVATCWFWRLTSVIVLVGLCAQFQVYHTAVINNIYDVAQPWLINQTGGSEDTAHTKWLTMVSAVPLGTVIGTLASGYLTECLGRKGALGIVAVLLTVAGLMNAVCKLVNIFTLATIGRLIIGFALGVAINAATMLIIESSPKEYRGMFAGCQQIFFGLGDLLAVAISLPQLLGSENLWPLAMAVGCIPGLFLLPFVLFWIPESPRYLYLKKNQCKEAELALKFYQGRGRYAQETRRDLHNEKQYSGSSDGSLGILASILTSKHRKALCLAGLVSFGMQMTGISVVMAFSTKLLQTAGFSHSRASWATLAMGLSKLFGGFLPPLLMDSRGRRTVNFLGLMGCALCLCTILGVFVLIPSNVENHQHFEAANFEEKFEAAFEEDKLFKVDKLSGVDTLSRVDKLSKVEKLSGVDKEEQKLFAGYLIAGVFCLYLILYSFVLSACFAYTAELFDQNARASALVLVSSFQWLVSTINTASFLPILDTYGVFWALVPYASTTIVTAILCHLLLPETSGKTFLEISNALSRKKKKGSDYSLEKHVSA